MLPSYRILILGCILTLGLGGTLVWQQYSLNNQTHADYITQRSLSVISSDPVVPATAAPTTPTPTATATATTTTPVTATATATATATTTTPVTATATPTTVAPTASGQKTPTPAPTVSAGTSSATTTSTPTPSQATATKTPTAEGTASPMATPTIFTMHYGTDPNSVESQVKIISAPSNFSTAAQSSPDALTFRGIAAPNSTVSLQIHSDPIIIDVQTDSSGKWYYVLRYPLSEGKHTVTVEITDPTTLQRVSSQKNFTVSTAYGAETLQGVLPSSASISRFLPLQYIFLLIGLVIISVISLFIIYRYQSKQVRGKDI